MEETQSDSKLEESIVSSRNSQSAAFTISFEEDQTKDENKKRHCNTNPFVKRHIRNKSLPVGPIETNYRKVHYDESKSYLSTNNGGGNSKSNSPNSSDGGTYTLDTDNSELQEARYSIDKVFGVGNHQVGQKTSGQWLDEWLQDSVQNVSRINVVNNNCQRLRTTSSSSTSLRQSKIPSPIYHNYQRISNSLVTVKSMQAALYKVKKPNDDAEKESNDREISEQVEKKKKIVGNNIITDSDDDKNTCEKQGAYTTRLNRAFSLRRDRLNYKSCASSIPSKLNTVTVQNSNINHQRYSSSSSLNLSNSVTKAITPSPPVSVIHKERKKKSTDLFKDKINNNVNNNNNCKTKSSHQTDLLNWRRRKNYDPIKAAAEGRRKSMEKYKKTENIPSMESGTTSTSVCRITRSASFQETVNYGYDTDTLSSADDTEITVSIEEDDYKIPRAPSTSLRNSPEGSIRSLVGCCSSRGNDSNSDNSNVCITQDEEGNVDARLFELSQQIRLSSYHLLRTLRTKNENGEESSNEMFSTSNTSTLDNLINVSLIIQDLHELLLP